MRKLTVVSLAMTLLLSVGGTLTSSFAQSPAPSDTPTFYRLVPGTYVNGWPRFSVRYPKDWVERPLNVVGGDVFRVSPPGPFPWSASFGVAIGPWPFPIEKWADSWVSIHKSMGMTDVTIVSDKPSRLRDGAPAREVEVKGVRNGVPYNSMSLATRKYDVQIAPAVSSSSGKIGEDLKAVVYSLEFEPGKDVPVTVPPDVQEFLDGFCSDIVSHDADKVVSRYSEGFLSSGDKKGQVGLNWRLFVGQIASCKVEVTDFVPAGDTAHLAGFAITNGSKYPLLGNSITIIKENGEWRIFGNQRNPPPSPPLPS